MATVLQTLNEYSDLYLKTVVLLADIFENFQDSCITSFGSDLVYYYYIIGFYGRSMLKHTRVNFELLTYVDMVLFIKRDIRGGLSQCSNSTRRPTTTCSRTIHRNRQRT